MIDRFNIIDEDLLIPLWRYMDFTKFIALLENSQLYFPNIDSFEDKYEGVHNAVGDNDFFDIDNDGNFKRINQINNKREQDNSNQIKIIIKYFTKMIRETVGVSCWRMSLHDSFSMWKAFLISKEGVAIKTTIEDIELSILDSNNNMDIKIGKIEYIDYQTDKIPINNIFNSIFYKNIYFDYEKELRLIAYELKDSTKGFSHGKNLKKTKSGYLVNVDNQILIKEIVISPYAPLWFYQLVKSMCEKYNILAPVNWSGIDLKLN